MYVVSQGAFHRKNSTRLLLWPNNLSAWGGQSRLGQARQLLPLYALSPGPEGLRPAPASDRTSVPSPPCCPAAGEQGLAISESLLSFLNSLCSQPLRFVYEPRPGGKAARCSNTSRVCYVRPTIQLQILSEKKGN